jgi:hypothetical protein
MQKCQRKSKKFLSPVKTHVRKEIQSQLAFHQSIIIRSAGRKIFSCEKMPYRIKWLIFCYSIKYSKKNVKKFLLHVVYE